MEYMGLDPHATDSTGGKARGTFGGPALDQTGTKATSGGAYETQGMGTGFSTTSYDTGAGSGYTGGKFGAAGVATDEPRNTADDRGGFTGGNEAYDSAKAAAGSEGAVISGTPIRLTDEQ